MLISYMKRYKKYLGPETLRYYFMQHILRINGNIPWPVHWTSTVYSHRRIQKQDLHVPTFLGAPPGCYIQANNGIILGENIWVGPGVKMISADHDLCDYAKHTPAPPIEIGDNCWLGADCKILAGVRLGNHTVVAAGAVVNKSFLEGNCVIGGVPARKLQDIGEYEGPMDGYELKLTPLYRRVINKIKRMCGKRDGALGGEQAPCAAPEDEAPGQGEG